MTEIERLKKTLKGLKFEVAEDNNILTATIKDRVFTIEIDNRGNIIGWGKIIKGETDGV